MIKEIEAFISGKKISGLIIGGSEEAVSRIREMLSATTHNRIVGTFHAEMLGKTDEILTKLESVIIQHERKHRDLSGRP